MILLWEHPLSPYAQKVKIALREKGVPFETRMPQGIGAGGAAGDFLRASPLAEVPALVDDGVEIFDSTIILEYIEAKWPKPALLPADPARAAKARMIEELMDTRYEAALWGVAEVRYFKRATGAEAERLIAAAAAQTAQLHQWLDRQLGSQTWFGGDQFGWADAACAPLIASATGSGLGPAPSSPLAPWLARALERESVMKSVNEARAALGGFDMVAQAVEAKLFKRQYRDHRLEWMIRSGGAEIVRSGVEAGTIRFSTDPAA